MKTRNESYGLYGTAKSNGQNPDELWAQCMKWLQEEHGMQAEDARNYLDSKHGRHLADALMDMTLEEIGKKWAKFMRRSVKEVIGSREAFEVNLG